MPSVMSKVIVDTPKRMGTRGSKRQRLDAPKTTLPISPTKPIHLPGEILVEVAHFLTRLDLDAVQFSCQRHRIFVQDNAHLMPLRDLAQISFDHKMTPGRVKVWVQPMVPKRPTPGTVLSIEFIGTWEEVLAEKDLFQNVVQYSVPQSLKLATRYMKWDDVSQLFGDAQLTIRVSRELVIGDQVDANIEGIKEFLRSFALINCLKFTHMRHWYPYHSLAKECDDSFLQWCTANSITQLEMPANGAWPSHAAILGFCFGPHGDDSDPRHLQARFRSSADFMEQLLEANRKCSRKCPITMDLKARAMTIDVPNVSRLAPYRVEGPRRNSGFEETVFLFPEEAGLKITYSYS